MIKEPKLINIFCRCGTTLPEYLTPEMKTNYLVKKKIIICLMCGRNLWSIDTSKSAFEMAMEDKEKNKNV